MMATKGTPQALIKEEVGWKTGTLKCSPVSPGSMRE